MFILKNKVGIIFQNTFIGKLRVFVYLFVCLVANANSYKLYDCST
jgi:hypothetical protein